MRIMLIAALLSSFSSLEEAPPRNAKTWATDPGIKTIRALYADTEAAVRAGKLKQHKRKCKDGGQPAVEATIYENSVGTVRKYLLSGASGDSAAEASYYYDERGRHRFTFESLRAVNGAKIETRTYLDEDGRVLHRDQKLKGEGWAGGFPDAISNPKESFDSLCK